LVGLSFHPSRPLVQANELGCAPTLSRHLVGGQVFTGVWERVHGGIIDGDRMHPASLINWSIRLWWRHEATTLMGNGFSI
jgi:hypothetical protein